MRQSLKENERLAAERRGQTLLRYQNWEDGKGGEQVSTHTSFLVEQQIKLNDWSFVSLAKVHLIPPVEK